MDNKAFVSQLARILDIDHQEAGSMLSAFVGIIKDSLENQDSVAIPGFGKFYVKNIEERISVDPTSNKRYLLPPRVECMFEASSMMKKRLEDE